MTASARPDLRDYTIVLADDDQMAQHARMAHHHWSHGKPYETFFNATMEEHNRAAWGRDGRHQIWALVRRDHLKGEVYAACEVYLRQALIKRPHTSEVEKGEMYAIASVVASLDHPRKGFATHLLKLLHYQLADPAFLPPFPESWGLPPPPNPLGPSRAIGSILYSDVGDTFYEKCTIGTDRPGWVVRKENCSELVWKCLPPSDTTAENGTEDFKWEWIGQEDVSLLADFLSSKTHDRLLNLDNQHTVYVPDPASPGVLTWLHSRGPWLSRKAPTEGEPIGLRTKNADGDDTIVLFTGYNEHVGPLLLVTYTHNLRAAHLESLLRKLDVAAARAGREKGWIWGPDLDGDLVKKWGALAGRDVKKGYRTEVKGHLLGVAWYGEEADKGELADSQIWHWC